jgi:hypothetical protein
MSNAMSRDSLKRYYQKNKKQMDASNKKWRNSEKGKEYRQKYAQEWRRKQKLLKQQFS